ncbi:MAG: AraC family transcriptional regulator [Planctomycetota bacterium]|jgi:AraC-like DNA-binding protein
MYKIDELPFKINSVGIFNCWPEWKWHPASSMRWNDLDLWTIASGRGIFKAYGKTYDLKPGDCFLLRGGEKYFCEHDPENCITTYFVHFNYYINGRKLDTLSKKMPLIYRHITDFDFFRKTFERLLFEYESGSKINTDSLFKTLLYEAGRVDTLPQLTGLAKEQSEKIAEICRMIKLNPGEKYSISELAEQCYYTASHFCRVFKSIMKVSPQDYIIANRIDLAKNMLLKSSNNISQIASALGYNNVYFFSRQFKKFAGLSPLQYRNRS